MLGQMVSQKSKQWCSNAAAPGENTKHKAGPRRPNSMSALQKERIRVERGRRQHVEPTTKRHDSTGSAAEVRDANGADSPRPTEQMWLKFGYFSDIRVLFPDSDK